MCNALHVYFHLDLCQGVYLQSHASNDQVWHEGSELMEKAVKGAQNNDVSGRVYAIGDKREVLT